MTKFIISAAIYIEDGQVHPHQPKNIKTGLVVTGRRHHNIYPILNLIYNERYINYRQNGLIHSGFITSDDLFVDRKEGAKIAFDAGQIDNMIEELYSENLY